MRGGHREVERAGGAFVLVTLFALVGAGHGGTRHDDDGRPALPVVMPPSLSHKPIHVHLTNTTRGGR